MMKRIKIIIILFILTIPFSCKKALVNKVPELRFDKMSSTDVWINSGEEILFTFSYQDGDGDLDNPASKVQNATAVKFLDLRDSTTLYFPFPDLPAGLKTSEGLKGILYVPAISYLFEIKTANPLVDTIDHVEYDVTLTDFAGNESARVRTPVLTIHRDK